MPSRCLHPARSSGAWLPAPQPETRTVMPCEILEHCIERFLCFVEIKASIAKPNLHDAVYTSYLHHPTSIWAHELFQNSKLVSAIFDIPAHPALPLGLMLMHTSVSTVSSFWHRLRLPPTPPSICRARRRIDQGVPCQCRCFGPQSRDGRRRMRMNGCRCFQNELGFGGSSSHIYIYIL